SLVFARSVPPHPCPLPQGEGEPRTALRELQAPRLCECAAADLPLPEGEGRGEGEPALEIAHRESLAIGPRISDFGFRGGRNLALSAAYRLPQKPREVFCRRFNPCQPFEERWRPGRAGVCARCCWRPP